MIARLRAASAEDRLLLIGLPLLVAALLTLDVEMLDSWATGQGLPQLSPAEAAGDERVLAELQRAVQSFQNRHGLGADGRIGAGTQRSLSASAEAQIALYQEIAVVLRRQTFWLARRAARTETTVGGMIARSHRSPASCTTTPTSATIANAVTVAAPYATT